MALNYKDRFSEWGARVLGPISIGVALLAGLAGSAGAAQDPPVRFRTQIKPILETHCFSCHNARTHSSGLVLETPEGILRGGALNGPAVLAGNAEASPLIHYLRGEKQPAMPLAEPPLPEEEIGLIAAWIDQLPSPADASQGKGAAWPFTRLKPPAIPAVRNQGWVRNPIDALVLAKLEKQGMQPAPPASRRSLLRRVYFDLIGMPPAPEAMLRFLRNPAEDAYEQEVEKLLRSPHYGERWGRHWLDLVRYADTEGGGPDYPRPHIWRYRDYVIRAFNQDRPYDRFVKEQLAGDLYAVNGAEGKLGLGFLNLGVVGEDSGRQNLLIDLVTTTGSVFLGLTLECARCHDHKYDPIPTRDYYRNEAFFSSLTLGETDLPFTQYEGPSLYPQAWKQRAEAWQRELDQRQELKKKTTAEFLKRLGKPFHLVGGQDLKDGVVPLNEAGELKAALRRGVLFSREERELYRLIERQNTSYGNVSHRDYFKPKVHTAWEIQSRYGGRRPHPAMPTTYILQGGSLEAKGEAVQPGFLSAVGDQFPFESENPRQNPRQTLAEWIAHPDNPLTARVMVNRIWQHHFGEGLVRTASDFGRNGSGTLHPELIDFLASYFVRNRWSVKAVHRLILQSNVYRQSIRNPRAEQFRSLDPDNRYFWRSNPLRLEAEAIRDSILAVSGELNPRMGGPGFFPEVKEDLLWEGGTWWKPSSREERNRRTVYMWQGRSFQLPMMNVFDGANLNESCWTRQVTTVAPQVFALFNNQFVHEQSRSMARRIVREAGSDPESQLKRAFQLALQRDPTSGERSRSLNFLTRTLTARQPPVELARGPATGKGVGSDASPSLPPPAGDQDRLADLCLVLLNMNEFIFRE